MIRKLRQFDVENLLEYYKINVLTCCCFRFCLSSVEIEKILSVVNIPVLKKELHGTSVSTLIIAINGIV